MFLLWNEEFSWGRMNNCFLFKKKKIVFIVWALWFHCRWIFYQFLSTLQLIHVSPPCEASFCHKLQVMLECVGEMSAVKITSQDQIWFSLVSFLLNGFVWYLYCLYLGFPLREAHSCMVIYWRVYSSAGLLWEGGWHINCIWQRYEDESRSLTCLMDLKRLSHD